MTGVLTSNAMLRRHWYAVARSSDVDPGPVAATVLGDPLVVWRDAARATVAAGGRCPHRQGPLADGTVAGGCLVCPYHGWTFGADGRGVHVPSAGPGAPVPPRAALAMVGCQERYGLVWVCLDEPAADIPPMAWDDDPRYRRINPPVEVWRTSATRMVDNFVDISHFPYVHAGTFGRGQDPVVAPPELGPLDGGFYGYRYEVDADNTRGGAAVTGSDRDVVHRAMTTGFALPFTVRSTIRYDRGLDGLEHVLLLLSTPIDDVTSYFTFVVWRNDDFAVPAEDVIAFDLAIGAEDKAMLERIDGVLALDQTALVNVRADACAVEWRRRLVALMNGPATRPDPTSTEAPR